MGIVPSIKHKSSFFHDLFFLPGSPVFFLRLLLLFSFQVAHAGAGSRSLPDTSRGIIIHSIVLHGNKQTRSSIILREVPFQAGDTLPAGSIRELLQHARENIFNTALFNIVTVDTVTVAGSNREADVIIRVIERWYIWPWPFFEISDRNFNTWIGTTDLDRLTYGIDLRIMNVTGRNETIKIPVHYGFNQELGIDYTVPYLDKRKTVGAGLGVEYTRNHEVIMETRDNKTVYYKDPDQFPRQELYAYAELLLRPTIYARHTFRISYSSWIFNDSLCKVPDYLPDSSHLLHYFSIYYQYKIDHRDRQFYPLKGSYFDLELDQNGLWSKVVNEFFLKTNLRKYIRMFPRWYFASGLTLKMTFTPQPSYLLVRGLGYGREVVRGYEYYVIDGKDFILWKNNFKFAILPERVFSIGFLRSRKFNTVPFALYLNVFCDAGYVSNDHPVVSQLNDLENRLLVGYGAGIDLTTYYDVVVRVEVSMNGEGEPGIYLHFIAPI